MAPQKFASVRQKTRPTRLAPFRDDTGLVALRYEQTKQAEPPIPLPPPRNPRRANRPASTIASSTSSSPTAAPITVSPPPIPPPQEEHPIFRNQLSPSPRSQADEWKRDSGLAPTCSSVTLRDEYSEDPNFQKLLEDIVDTPSIYPTDEQKPLNQGAAKTPVPLRLSIAIPPRSTDFDRVVVSPTHSRTAHSLPATPTRQISLTERLGKTFGLRSSGSKKLRKKMLGDDKSAAASQDAPLGATPASSVRGSLRSSPKSSPTAATGSPVPNVSPSADRGARSNPAGISVSSPTTPEKDQQLLTTDFMPLDTPIPDDSLWDDLGDLSFSKRGSIMFGGKRDPFKMMLKSKTTDTSSTTTTTTTTTNTMNPGNAAAIATASAPEEQTSATTEPASASAPHSREVATAAATTTNNIITTSPTTSSRPEESSPESARASSTLQHGATKSVPSIRVLPVDVERESQKVRSLYESGEGGSSNSSYLHWEDGGHVSFASSSSTAEQRERLEPTVEVPSEEEENVTVSSSPLGPLNAGNDRTSQRTTASITPRSANSLSPLRDSGGSARRADFLKPRAGGGIEDWEDVRFSDVDRYGFISARPSRPETRSGTPESAARSAQLQARRRNVLTKRPTTAYSSSGGYIRPPSRKVSTRSLNTFTSEFSTLSRRSTRSSIRSATNRLPHNRDRRWMDEAAEMLALQAGLTGITDEEKAGKHTEAQKRKELERAEKWRRMATVVKPKGKDKEKEKDKEVLGQGMDYEFDMKNAKLIERTWKGIPDSWRAAAWWSFLATSAKSWNSTETEEHLISEFQRLQGEASPDDVQIDLDVPRTINGHIMFRRRYRGGQRLLFRVLHAISLYFPELGYVQGMAPLAATLLCYFDEERCFVMLVRMWRYRGLEHLYKPGFAELMAVLKDFEKRWLAGKDVAGKLEELCIDATAYGTRWYLTLFNLSIPFQAQLRVWDVFMLLGECPPPGEETPDKKLGGGKDGATTTEPPPPPKGLDVLHATSAALINALRDVLMDSDFENAMKALTAWIPIKDEDLLMKVTRAEWRMHHREKEGRSSVFSF
ncbi:hypothetical protein QBC35DRAFT_118235 [Podospora australis]|uniref:Rab-GAP TBC domain-containing protein n=1 Tax=Podospora australis TaxID=1536484 RepID=A0AAN6X1Y4_9PEZI|nr:hypothetical protein QBC35DRAFT_118235 [Podospora australis]